jgi:flagellar protein FliO/FliZ
MFTKTVGRNLPRLCGSVFILVFLSLNFPVYSQQSKTAAQNPADESALVIANSDTGAALASSAGGGGVWAALRIVLLLVVAAAAVYGVVYFLKRSGRTQDKANPHLKVLASTGLGVKGALYVASVGSQAWLIGAGESGQPALIAEISDREAIDAMSVDYSREQGKVQTSSFRELLGRFGQAVAPKGSLGETSGIARSRERLRSL